MLFVVDIGDKWKRETASPEDSLFVVLMVGEPLTHVTDKDWGQSIHQFLAKPRAA
jgi:hypothetical protein